MYFTWGLNPPPLKPKIQEVGKGINRVFILGLSGRTSGHMKIQSGLLESIGLGVDNPTIIGLGDA